MAFCPGIFSFKICIVQNIWYLISLASQPCPLWAAWGSIWGYWECCLGGSIFPPPIIHIHLFGVIPYWASLLLGGSLTLRKHLRKIILIFDTRISPKALNLFEDLILIVGVVAAGTLFCKEVMYPCLLWPPVLRFCANGRVINYLPSFTDGEYLRNCLDLGPIYL